MSAGSVVTREIQFDTDQLGKSITVDSVMGAKVCGMIFNPQGSLILLVIQEPAGEDPAPLTFVIRENNDGQADIVNERWVGSFFQTTHNTPYHVFKVA